MSYVGGALRDCVSWLGELIAKGTRLKLVQLLGLQVCYIENDRECMKAEFHSRKNMATSL